MENDDDTGQARPKFGFRIYENFRNIVKKSSKSNNYDLSEAHCPTYEDVEVTGTHALNSLDSSMTNDSLNIAMRNDGNATDDSGIDSIDQNGSNSSPEPLMSRSIWKREFVLHEDSCGDEAKKKVEATQTKAHNVPIYSSVVKKKSNPARDFALTVLQNDRLAVKTKKDCSSSDLTEISQLLTETNQLLNRNSNLRASLTISVKRSNSKKATTTTFVLPKRQKAAQFEVVDIDLKVEDKSNLTDSGRNSDSDQKGSSDGSDKCDSSNSEGEESSESTLPSLEPINPFTRYNPSRRPINGHTSNPPAMEVRRSIRLAPKTVASLACKFDNLLTTAPDEQHQQQQMGRKSSQLSAENKLGKKDITKIISTLEKLDEDAKKASLVLQKNKLLKAAAAANDESKQKKENIDNLMKSTKSALEEVELPSCTSQAEGDGVKNQPEPSVVVSSSSTSLTDKYLLTLQRIAKENADTGLFRTSLLPQNGDRSNIVKIHVEPPPKTDSQEEKKTINEASEEEPLPLEGKSFHGSFWSTLSHSYAELNDLKIDDYLRLAEKRCQSEDNLSQLTYDQVEAPSDLVVTARPAIVTEDQMDSLSFYDDVGTTTSLGGDLYESIAGSILNLAKRNRSMEDMYSSMLYSSDRKNQTSGNTDKLARGPMQRSLSNYSEAAGQKSVTSDEWIDLEEETDTETYYDSEAASSEPKNAFLRATNARCSNRLSTRKRWQNNHRSSRRNWTQMAAAAAANSPKGRKGDDAGEEELYESIYEVIQHKQQPTLMHNMSSSTTATEYESDFDDIQVMVDGEALKSSDNRKISKLAEAANKKMKKLRRNWSLKKNDISKSWSRIRKYSNPAFINPVGNSRPGVTISHANTLKRKPSTRRPQGVPIPDTKSVVRHHGGPVIGDGSNSDTTFYITLTIEQDDEDDDDPLDRLDGGEPATQSAAKKGWRPKRRVGGGSTSTSASSGVASGSNLEADSRSASISMSGSSVLSGATSKSSPETSISNSTPTSLPPKLPKARKPSSILTRPTAAPPAPPPRKPSRPTSFILGPKTSESDSCDSSLVTSETAQETYMSSFFQTEPLYQQFYTNQLLRAEVSSTEDMYECVEHPDSLEEVHNKSSQAEEEDATTEDDEEAPTSVAKLHHRPSAMDLTSACTGGRRSMWSEVPEVMGSGILDNITTDAKKLHEAMFEVITSEASYLKSLNVLLKHFAQSPKLSGSGNTSVISKWDHKRLFGDVINVRQCSEKFLEDLEKRWQSSILLDGICEVVRDHARDHFQVYVKYCSNQVDQGKLLNELNENPRFVESLKELESSPVCQSMKMQSFLILPMQRITRLPLLIDAIFSRLDDSSPEFEPCREALSFIEKVVHECNDSALIEGRRKEMLLLEQQLKFRGDVKLFPLCSASRWLVKRGDVTRIYWKENAEAKLTFGRKVSKQNYNFLLFNDILVIAKKKSDGTYLVVDYCPRNLVQMANLMDDSHNRLPYGMSHAKNIDLKQIVLFTMLQNHEHKTTEWLLQISSESVKKQWIELVTPPSASPENPAEKIYEPWDCPLVEAVATVQAETSSEIQLQKGDKANVLRKLSDSGWYYVEKLGDGQKGWVPMAATREIESNHIRARNFKQRHAFLKLLTSLDSSDSTTTTISSDLLNNNNRTNRSSLIFEE